MNKKQAKAIVAYCLMCAGDSQGEVETCSFDDCPLYPFRLGDTDDKDDE